MGVSPAIPECEKCFDEFGSYACVKFAHSEQYRLIQAIQAAINNRKGSTFTTGGKTIKLRVVKVRRPRDGRKIK